MEALFSMLLTVTAALAAVLWLVDRLWREWGAANDRSRAIGPAAAPGDPPPAPEGPLPYARPDLAYAAPPPGPSFGLRSCGLGAVAVAATLVLWVVSTWVEPPPRRDLGRGPHLLALCSVVPVAGIAAVGGFVCGLIGLAQQPRGRALLLVTVGLAVNAALLAYGVGLLIADPL